jgi:hypothetical protein
VLSEVDPWTVMGCTYVISEKESYCTTNKLEAGLHRLKIAALTGNIYFFNEKLILIF